MLKKRLVSAVLMIAFIVSSCPIGVLAAETPKTLNETVEISPGFKLTVSVATPHEYLGTTTIPGIYYGEWNSEDGVFYPNELVSFDIFVVDDAQEFIDLKLTATGGIDAVYSEPIPSEYSGGVAFFDNDSSVYIVNYPVGATYKQVGNYTDSSPVVIEIDYGFDYMINHFEKNGEYAGYIRMSSIVISKTDVKSLLETEKLPEKLLSDLEKGILVERSVSTEELDLSNLITLLKSNYGAITSTTVAPVAETTTATPTLSIVLVNGKETGFDAYNINGNNYFKLRDLAYVLNGTSKQFSIGYDETTMAITLISNQQYTPNGSEMATGDGRPKTAILTASRIYKDGNELGFPAYNIGGNNFFKLRDLMGAFDIGVTYDATNRKIGIDTSSGYETP